MSGKQPILPHFARTRQGKTNPGTGTRLRVDPHAPAVGFDDRLGEVQPQPGTLGLADGLVGAVKAVEDIGDVGGVNPGPLVADGDDHLFGADLTADADLAFGGIFNGVRDKVGNDLDDAVLVGEDDGEFCGEVDHEGVAVGLSAETRRGVLGKGWDGNVGQVGGEPASLQAGGIQQVLDHGGQVVGLLLDHGETVLDNGLIPFGVFAAQGADVALDERHGSFQLVADDGDEGVLDLVGIAKLGDVAHGGDDIAQGAVGGKQGGIGDADGQGRRFRALEVTFDIKIGVGGERPAGGLGFLEGEPIRAARPADDIGMGLGLEFGARATV